jgi:hypothetical protein
MRRLLVLLLQRKTPRQRPVPIDSERLLRIYRETHRQVEDLRRAA